ncbi:hypothetical protein F0562_018976 [Nyssa sinensis]|uniref:CCHC-type domain-containing protein n=1 Tax=Nyssa sinensis TaxID=561372 RepID=A0A5J4Z9I5_9ASTE|nr:hypothetical protein F0562_018976 [Nyssa sinensis]
MKYALEFFQTYKGLIVDLIIFSFRERKHSRDFFLERTARDAFRVVEVELNFIYEVLYTKIVVVRGTVGYLLRFASFGLVVATFVLFCRQDQKQFLEVDVKITYTLLGVAIALDVIAFVRFIFSDWTAVALKKSSILGKVLFVNRKRWFEDSIEKCPSWIGLPIRILYDRWSESMSQYNLIYYSLNARSDWKEKLYGYVGIDDFLDGIIYVNSESFTPQLRDFIFRELKEKAKMGEDLEAAKQICSGRGDWTLQINGWRDLLPWIIDIDYDEILLLWHIATELCYCTDEDKAASEAKDPEGKADENKQFCKILSDYMLYLLMRQTEMMSAVAGDRSKSVLFEACRLANKLKEMTEENNGPIRKKDKWEIMSKVWVELLSYATTRCRANAHANGLSKGGELITLEGESVNEYFARTLTIANKMRIHGEEMEDVVVIKNILRSMTSKYNYVVCSIEESNDLDILSIDELQSSLLVHEQRMGRHTVDEQALKVTYDVQQGGRGGRNSFRGRGRGRGRNRPDTSTFECYNCHELGHFQWECPKKGKDSKGFYPETSEEMLLVAYVDIEEVDREELWFLDSECSNHMCGKKEMFTNLDDTFRKSVKLGNNSSLAVLGKGNVHMEVNRIMQVITRVFYVPDLKNNLLSIGQLQEKGLAFFIQNGKCMIYHPDRRLIWETTMATNRMFILLVRTQSQGQKRFNTIADDQPQLWHRRYRHLVGAV